MSNERCRTVTVALLLYSMWHVSQVGDSPVDSRAPADCGRYKKRIGECIKGGVI